MQMLRLDRGDECGSERRGGKRREGDDGCGTERRG